MLGNASLATSSRRSSKLSLDYPPDEVLSQGLTIEVSNGVITRVSQHGPQQLIGARYVVGDVDDTDITPPLWRFVDLEMPKPDGSIAKLSIARPLWWMEETGAKAGTAIDLGLQEIGISGEAKVLRIRPCMADSRTLRSERYLVTGTIEHQNAIVFDLVFDGDSDKPLGVTAQHPIYSFDRDDWVPAGELKLNERVRAVNGTAVLTAKSERPDRHTVYNLEVHRCHAYHVSQFGILAHNTGITCIDPKTIRFTQDSIASRFRNGNAIADTIAGLKSGAIKPSDLPPIRIFERDGTLWTLDNRRLHVFQEAGIPIRTVQATAEEIARELPSKFTTITDGLSIIVRGLTE
jgi:hypothetical protein